MGAPRIKAGNGERGRKRLPGAKPALRVLTIGHSTRTIGEFVGLLSAHGVTCVADVRTIPGSRHNPQFNQTALRGSLKGAGVSYVHLPGLGGLRRARPDSINLGWRNASFRGYADYMQTPEFARSLDELVRLAKREPVAIMCAEAVPWRCHRSLIGDALLVREVRVEDILGASRRQVRTLTPFAKVRGTRITYPAGAARRTLPAAPARGARSLPASRGRRPRATAATR